jgi:hypothetical protein
MSRATTISAKVFAQRVNESVFNIIGNKAGDGGGTASTKNIEDHLRAKGYVNGREYRWLGPYKLQIASRAIDRDLLDSIQSGGGEQEVEAVDMDYGRVGPLPYSTQPY